MSTTRRGLGFLLAAALTGGFLLPVDQIEAQLADLVSQGRQALDARRIDEAISLLERAVSADARNPVFHKTPVAVQDLSKLVTMREASAPAVPETVMPAVYLNLGRAHKRNRQPAEARAAWEKGRRLYPAAPEAQASERELRSL